MTDAAQRWFRCVPAWVLSAVVAAAVAVAVAFGWDWLQGEWDWLRGLEPFKLSSATLRNFTLISIAIIGLFFALWRNLTADKQAETANKQAETANEQAKTANEQAKTANEQAKTANEQAKTAARGLRNERYQKGADMLGNDTLATRLGGVYALEQLAHDHPEEYHIQIVKLLCVFIRHPAEDGRPESGGADGGGPDDSAYVPVRHCAPDIEAAAQAIGDRRVANDRCVESDRRGFVLNLRGANLSGANLSGANLSGAHLEEADLRDANLEEADLRAADLRDANLEGAHLEGANLWHANLWNANLEGAHLEGADLTRANLGRADLEGVKGLTQSGLDAAFIREGEDPPRLEGALDTVTGEPLVWQGKELPLEDEAGD